MWERSGNCSGNFEEERGIAVPEFHNVALNCACGKKFTKVNLLLLKDIKGFTGRKIYFEMCPCCKKFVITLVEKDKESGKVYVNENITGAPAFKILSREQKRKITAFPKIEYNTLYGWIYGHNVQIRNKKGKVTQIRQYSSDFYGQKELIKSMFA